MEVNFHKAWCALDVLLVRVFLVYTTMPHFSHPSDADGGHKYDFHTLDTCSSLCFFLLPFALCFHWLFFCLS